MQMEDLVAIVLDVNLGAPWPEMIDKKPHWPVGRSWRVEYTFSSPAVPLQGLALGNEVRGVWRYEVIGEEKDEKTGDELVNLRVSPERRGAAGYHFIATYRRRDLQLLAVRRFEGDEERPFELKKLPPLDQGVSRSEDGRTFERSFEMKPPPAPPEVVEDAAFAGAETIPE
jgi:hypothetical protein